MNPIKNIVFDLGGVLVDWNPRYLYRKLFQSNEEMEHFLTKVVHQEWNEKQDAGRSFAEGIAELITAHPEHREMIEIYNTRWEEMLKGPIEPVVEILERLHAQKSHRLLGLSNWSQEKFPIAEKNYPFLKLFEGIVVSGRVGMKKPDPRIFQLLCKEYGILPAETVFIDDVIGNIEAAKALGFATIHFQSPAQLKTRLRELSLLS